MPTVPKQVKGFFLRPPPDRIGVEINWQANTELDLDFYEILRGGAVVSAENAEPYAVSNGDILSVIIDGSSTVQVTLSNAFITDGAATVAQIIANLTAVLSGVTVSATTMPAGSSFLLRSNNDKKTAMLEISGGTAQSALGLPSGKFRNNDRLTIFQIIGSVLAANPLTLTDLNGTVDDFYRVRVVSTSALLSQNSVTRSLERIIDEIPQKIFIFGRIHNAGGQPMTGTEIFVLPCQDSKPSLNFGLSNFLSFSSADFGITFDKHKVLTDEDGYFEIEATAETKLRLYIPAISYDHQILTTLNNQDFVNLRIVG